MDVEGDARVRLYRQAHYDIAGTFREDAVKRWLVFGLSLVLASSLAFAQGSVRVRGTITALDGNVLSVVDAEGKTVAIQLGEKTEIVFTQQAALADIQPGDFLGVTSRKPPMEC